MREDIANLIHPVLSYGLQLKQRLEEGDSPDLDTEQAALKGLLLSDHEARRLADFGGEAAPEHSIIAPSTRAGDSARRAADHFLGIRYSLICWLDEMFIMDSSWSTEWNEKKLEPALYGTNDRAWRFWEQARKAEARSGSDALEVFFLCVMLGFRGELRDEPEKLQAWVSATQTRISKTQGREWPMPPELGEPPTNVPPRRGRDELRRAVLTGAAILSVLIPVMLFILARQLFWSP